MYGGIFMHLLRKKINSRLVSVVLSALMVLFGAGFETVEACCKCLCLHTTAQLQKEHSLEHRALSSFEHSSKASCCCTPDLCSCLNSEHDGCSVEVTHYALDNYTPSERVQLLNPERVAACWVPIWSFFGLIPSSFSSFFSSLSELTPPPLVRAGRVVLGLSCILII